MGALLHRLGPNTVRILALFAVLIGIILFFSTQIDNYLNARLFNRISTSVAIITLIAVGQAIVVLTRNIDLSVGSVVGCVAYFLGGILGPIPTFLLSSCRLSRSQSAPASGLSTAFWSAG